MELEENLIVFGPVRSLKHLFEILTLHAQHDLRLLGLRAEVVDTLASVLGLVVLRASDESQRVPALPARGGVRGVDLGPVPEPRGLGQRVPAGSGAHQGHGLTLTNGLPVQVARDLRRTGGI